MVISTALMIGGAIAGGIGGGMANNKRISNQQDELDILNMKKKQNAQELKSSVVSLKNSVENQSIQATQGSRKDAIEAYQAESSASASAGSSGLQGGTPFYKIGQIASDAAQTIQENQKMRSNQIQSTEEQGAAEISGIKTNSMILDKQISSSQKEMSYLESPLGWSQAILTGALSGASTANQISTGLEGIGVDTGAELFKSVAPVNTGDAATAIGASGAAAAGVTPDLTGSTPSTIAAGPKVSIGESLNDIISNNKFGSGVNFGITSIDPNAGLVPDFGSMINNQVKGFSSQGYGITSLKKNQVPDSFNVFSGIQLN